MHEPFAITRDPQTKAATLAVQNGGAWQAFAGRCSAAVDYDSCVASGNGPGRFPLPGTTWSVFALRQNGTTCMLAERQLPMQGGYNFRDLGGFTGHGGKRTIWGKLFRADDLLTLTEGDTDYLATIPITTIIDFRTGPERDHAPDRVPPGVKYTPHYPVAPGYMNAKRRTYNGYADADTFMLDIYRDLATDPLITQVYKKFFIHVQNAGNLPLLFHCSAGKDRTGFAAALILLALGVSRETVFADFEASNRYLGDKYAPLIEADPDHKDVYTVKKTFLAESLDRIEERYGSVNTYLTTALRVDLELLRGAFLE